MRTRVLVMASQLMSARWAFNCGAWAPTERDWQLLASGLGIDDKEQVGKYVFQRDAKSAMVGRFLTRKFVSESTGLPWRDIEIRRDTEHKKPYVSLDPSFPKVQFNISHSGDYVVLAGELGDLSLGVDLMKIEKQRTTSPSEFFRLMNKQFSKEEWSVVKSQTSEADQMSMFYRFWCLKESYTKATGTGITVDLQKICFKLKDLSLSESKVVKNTEVFVDGQKQYGWVFEESLINGDHIATVAIHNTDRCLTFESELPVFRQLSYFELISLIQQVSDYDEVYSKKCMSKKLMPQ